jgi:SNF2 family DNA or RNA helicase
MDLITFAQAFNVHGVEIARLNGSQEFEARAAIVNRFNKDPDLRVILISNAGSTGLNLNIADSAIILDALWTLTQAEQIEGRVKRLGQTETVNIFYITALKTTDIMMNAIAATKGRMFEEFVGWKQNRGKHLSLSEQSTGDLN